MFSKTPQRALAMRNAHRAKALISLKLRKAGFSKRAARATMAAAVRDFNPEIIDFMKSIERINRPWEARVPILERRILQLKKQRRRFVQSGWQHNMARAIKVAKADVKLYMLETIKKIIPAKKDFDEKLNEFSAPFERSGLQMQVRNLYINTELQHLNVLLNRCLTEGWVFNPTAIEEVLELTAKMVVLERVKKYYVHRGLPKK